jgi:cytochrome c556
MRRGTVPFDAGVAQSTLLVVAADLENFPNLFPDDSQQAPTHALPAVWSNRPPSAALAMKAVSDAKAAAVDATSAVGLRQSKAFADMKAGCTVCHTQFRDF